MSSLNDDPERGYVAGDVWEIKHLLPQVEGIILLVVETVQDDLAPEVGCVILSVGWADPKGFGDG